MQDYKPIPERADELFRRISRVLDHYTEVFEELEREDKVSDDLTAEMVLAKYNFSQISALYELDKVGFFDTYKDVAGMEDEDILYTVLIKEAEKS